MSNDKKFKIFLVCLLFIFVGLNNFKLTQEIEYWMLHSSYQENLIYDLNSEIVSLQQDIKKYRQDISCLNEQLSLIQAGDYKLDIPLIFTIYNKATNPELVFAIIEQESNFKPNAINTNRNGTVDRGLMQINSNTAPSLWKNVFPNEPYDYRKLFDPKINLKLGIWYFNYLLDKYKDVHKALTAYNRGEVGLFNYMNKHGTAESRYSKSILEKVK